MVLKSVQILNLSILILETIPYFATMKIMQNISFHSGKNVLHQDLS